MGKGYEKGESQTFWIELLHDVLGVERPTEFISFENQVKLSHTSFIDAYIPSTKVLIEQKSMDKDLRASIRQSDGTMLTPFQQAKRYASELPVSKHPRWVVVCNFQSFLIYDMEQPQGEPFELLLQNLEKDYHQLQFLVGGGQESLRHEMEVSIKAGSLVGKIYDSFLKQYGDSPTSDDLHSLNVLCVRLVFCLYAEDAGLFGKDQFYNYLSAFQPEQMRMALSNLFVVLDTPADKRDRFLEPQLAAFPYVNGSLFSQRPGESIPPFTPETAEILLDKSSRDFDWSEISPTIFGAVFESTLNPDTRRSGGMHYTSIENIHKVIDPLFMDDLNDEFARISHMPTGKQQRQLVDQFQDKLASLSFLDPACGSGNFLTETYISLRKLENQAIKLKTQGQVLMGLEEVSPIKVSIHQFYGIEINDFAVTVATTALWIAESQMMAQTQDIIQFKNDFLPLKNYANIREGNALRIDWAEVIDPKQLSYIIGNPPFVGARMMNKEQKDDALEIFGKKWKNVGNLDYVACWYKKATDFMQGTEIRTALVSTNSISQGEQVANLWKPLMEESGVHIDFAWRTFRWDSESSLKAHVHCVIVGFSIAPNSSKRKLFFSDEICKSVENINGYLIDAENIFVESRSKSLCDVPNISIGCQIIDGGNFLFKAEEMEDFISKEPSSKPYFHPLFGSEEFINRRPRYCLWLGDCSPSQLRSMPLSLQRVQNVRLFRLSSKREATLKLADKPNHFGTENMPNSNFIIVPKVSSEHRRYIPMGLMTPDNFCSDLVFLIPDATIYHFGVLESVVHMSWMRAVCGRLKSDYRYSKDIVYNNFPWPTPTDAQKAKIEQTAQAILDARALYPDSSLADLYDEVTMPPELRKAHQQNDRAVMEAYGFGKDLTENDIVAELLKMYQQLIKREIID
ncbi:MAG: class I SAM-dependent DNA methyltransferase [Bacteroidales bacterium]|nr:class I SAM-dependent DNA methyltransferase [Candidatus Colimorpha merdihippi]